MSEMMRLFLAVVYIVFLIFWFGLISFMMFEGVEVSTFEAFGLGTATGVFLTAFTLMWQFYWRKAPSENN